MRSLLFNISRLLVNGRKMKCEHHTGASRLHVISICSHSIAALAKARVPERRGGVALGGRAGCAELSEGLPFGWQSGEIAGDAVCLNRQGQRLLAACTQV